MGHYHESARGVDTPPIVAARRSRSAGPILRKAIVDDIVAGSSQLGDSYMAKKSKRRAWTTADVRMLKTAARKKTRASSIARTLKRTDGATRQKAFSLGLSLNSRA